MKKLLVWFCGTGTQTKDMEFLYTNSEFDKSYIIDGVGTKTMTHRENTLKESETWGLKSWVNSTRNLVFGYTEETTIVGIDTLIDTLVSDLERLATSKEQVDLVIGGHSRGAAVGLVTFLASLNEQVTFDIKSANVSDKECPQSEESSWRVVKSLRIIAADPVSGRQIDSEDTNDMFGVSPDMKLDDLLLCLRHSLFSQVEQFQVYIYSARFEVRNAFRFDSRWFDFVDKIKEDNQSKIVDAHLLIGGFRHSAMVSQSDELTELYDDLEPDLFMNDLNIQKASPISLLYCLVLGADEASIEHIYTQLRNRELLIIDNINDDSAISKLLMEKTKTSSYKYFNFDYFGFFGKSLSEYMKELPTAVNEKANVFINNRYLFR
ncbi:hypothetical protein [Celerinatantimonas sp. MCCC 1A17872]|uniref:hypothetical protein n=1 Tax=Celerinatantimonas sp. MCCC 1A17872 TaxID=3177514 RepID=UPI0038C4AA3D